MHVEQVPRRRCRRWLKYHQAGAASAAIGEATMAPVFPCGIRGRLSTKNSGASKAFVHRGRWTSLVLALGGM